MPRIRLWTIVLCSAWLALGVAAVETWTRLDPLRSPVRRFVDGLLPTPLGARSIPIGWPDLLALVLIVAGGLTATALRRRFLRRHL